MSSIQNLSYSVVQVLHNFGAVAAVGGSVAAVFVRDAGVRGNLAWMVLSGLILQSLSGAGFGAVSYFFHYKFPDISGIAFAALAIKMLCVSLGIPLLSIYIVRSSTWTQKKNDAVWVSSSALAVIALTAAAILRWFS